MLSLRAVATILHLLVLSISGWMKYDYRQKPRRALRYHAWVETGVDDVLVACAIADMSVGGAKFYFLLRLASD
jgi:hypothetical protein